MSNSLGISKKADLMGDNSKKNQCNTGKQLSLSKDAVGFVATMSCGTHSNPGGSISDLATREKGAKVKK